MYEARTLAARQSPWGMRFASINYRALTVQEHYHQGGDSDYHQPNQASCLSGFLVALRSLVNEPVLYHSGPFPVKDTKVA